MDACVFNIFLSNVYVNVIQIAAAQWHNMYVCKESHYGLVPCCSVSEFLCLLLTALAQAI